MSRPISITQDTELKLLFDRLVNDIIDAGGLLRLHAGLAKSSAEYYEEVCFSPGFWGFSGKAILESGFIHLARVYDQDNRCLSLITLLHTIGQHTSYFQDDAVLKRVSKAYAEEFAPGSHRIDAQQLERDIATVSSEDPLVKKLIIWRSNFGAHLSTTPILEKQKLVDLSRNEGLQLVARAFDIFNRYLSSFEGVSFSTKIIGEDDYTHLFELLRLGHQKFMSH